MSLKRIWPTALAPVAAVGFVPATGRATSMSAPPTLADMVRDASEIVVGTVKDVREVRQGALPVMEVEAPRANDGESSVLASTRGPVNAPALVGLVRRAVTEGFWNGRAR